MDIIHLTLEDALLIHADQIERYGGSGGIRDIPLLESAVAAVQAGFGGQPAHQDLFEMAAAYLFHLVKNHPFIDGNKRTGLAMALVFLDLNGYRITIDDNQLFQLVLDVVENRTGKIAIAQVFRNSVQSVDSYFE